MSDSSISSGPVSTQADYLQQVLGYTEPIFNASMAGAAGGALAAAVSEAGGVGMLGIGGSHDAGWVKAQSELAAAPGKPWGAGLMAWVLEESLEPLKNVLEHAPSFICVSFGDPGPAARLAHQANALVGMQVGNAAELSRALESDIDVVICRGSEGGGHGRNNVSTLPLLQLALSRTSKPVIVAGGLATAQGVAAVLGAGASAAWIGTRFAAAAESLSHTKIKEAIGSASIDDTVYTRAFDVAQRIAWPVQYGGRALRNEFSDQWVQKIAELRTEVARGEELTEMVIRARMEADVATAPVYAGQSAGLSSAGMSAAQIVEELSEFRSILTRAAQRWG
ncbi:2-nitropropane dioxygenase [Arthrobacter sp. MYb227]|uniref:NAD(P)H-dependent flavin oxidoreductase n=1 Tax=Arthrobacter sp. MYb227 TaxID=1848601 RepID=UPI000CFBB19A|nr:nitronate monooxygenase [Arthrobacter sp. MYb227]PQZ90194.1 2-nitropropane dioxygenase [Arthrobacter sp. MYb227]